jgi:hypothetical protein
MADNIWNEGKSLTCGLLDGIMLHGSSTLHAVHVWGFVYDLSAVGSSHQLH